MLQRGWWIIALTALSALIIALISSYRTAPTYSTSARFIISPNLEQGANGSMLISSISALDKRSIASTFAEVLDSESVYNEASTELKIDPVQLRAYTVSTVVLPDANILEVSVSGADPQVAALLANSVGQKGIDYVTNLYPVYTVDVLDAAVPPSSPISPNPKRDASLALVVGTALGVALLFIREQMRAPLVSFQQQVSTDSLSSAYTRRYVLQQLETLVQRDGSTASMGIVQFDGLQDLVETLPKPLLQRVLQHITSTFRNELRGSDLIGRWDDKSFVVVLPKTSGAVAAKTIETICQSLSKPLDFDQSGETIALTPRAGVIECQGSEPVTAVVERAEAAMEQARKSGNKATVFSMDMQPASL